MPEELDRPLTVKRIHLWAPSIVAVAVAAGAWVTRSNDVEVLKADVAAIKVTLSERDIRFRDIEKALSRIEGKLDK